MMYAVWAILGALLCLALQQSVFALVVGSLLGLLWAHVSAVAQSLQALRRQLEHEDDTPRRATTAAHGAAETDSAQPATPTPTRDITPTPAATFHIDAIAPPAPPQPTTSTRHAAAPDDATPSDPPSEHDVPTRGWTSAQYWFTSGNVPVKVGMLVLFAGVAALLRYTADTWLQAIPMGVRFAAVALVAVCAWAFGWRQRQRRRVFGLSVQGGAIGILIITVFSALRLYSLLSPPTAFVLLAVLIACTGLLALLQESLALAVLGLVAGFAAPLLTSTGHGSHVVLFGYYAVLNAGILWLAWKRTWRWLNLLGFVATFAIGTIWGVLQYRPMDFASTEPFLVLNFLFYLAIPWLYLRQRPDERKRVVDGCLLFGNPLASLLLQGFLLQWRDTPMAISTAVAAVVYLLAAWSMRERPRMGLLRDAWIVLAGVFATLTVPLALSADLTSCVLALEGAGVVWLGWRQQRRFARWCGLGLQLLAAVAWFSAPDPASAQTTLPVLNGHFIGAMLIVAGGLAICRLYVRHGDGSAWMNYVRLGAFGWSLLWWLCVCIGEIGRVLGNQPAIAGIWILLAATAWLTAEMAGRLPAAPLGKVAAWTSVVLTALTLLIASPCLWKGWQPLHGWLLLATVLTFPTGWRMLMTLRTHAGAASTAQLLWWWRWIWIAGMAVAITMHDVHRFADAWRALLTLLPALIVWFAALRRPGWLASPARDTFVWTRPWLVHTLTAVLALIFVFGLFAEGGTAPLPFIPLLNPLELLLLAIALGLGFWTGDDSIATGLHRLRSLLLGAICLVLASSIVLRAVHQLGGVPWNGALASSALAQLSLTLVWSVFGLLGWLWGSRRKQRLMWQAGAVTMAMVLLKLLLIDRGQLGNLFGITSFIAYGLLCTVIGYLAPAPPKVDKAEPAQPL